MNANAAIANAAMTKTYFVFLFIASSFKVPVSNYRTSRKGDQYYVFGEQRRRANALGLLRQAALNALDPPLYRHNSDIISVYT